MRKGTAKSIRAKARAEGGQAAVELALLIPALLVLLFGACDLSMQAVCARQAQSAAASAATELAAVMDAREASGVSTSITSADAADYVNAKYPALRNNAATSVSVTAKVERRTVSYRHKTYDTASSAPSARTSTAATGTVTVTVDVRKGYVTPIAPILALIGGSSSNDYTARGSFSAPYDRTGAGW